MNLGKWDARIRRANQLAAEHSFAAEALKCYERLTRYQKSLYSEIEAACGTAKVRRMGGTLRAEFDAFLLLPRFGAFLSLMKEAAPEPLAQATTDLQEKGSGRWQEVLKQFWESEAGTREEMNPDDALISRLFLQPYAEYIADYSNWVLPHGTPSVCPLCLGKPLVGVLRPEGDGAKRFLACFLCAMEWEYRRLVCPSCGEEDANKLAVYTAKEFAHVRVEACDTCRVYIKSVDLTKDGHAVPAVDELATIPLNLWATEHGYRKLQANLLGI
ncbi:MAG TPA: formate dehydrogenase accessory protein FdhE [Candidatus Acidoferrum sp.]|nr:formate dehydrogenase accessory protein FdhE [Candidatus Acidoferrum sp.]